MNILRKISAIGTAVAILLSSPQLEIKANAAANICGIETGENIENQDYNPCTSVVKSYLAPCGAELMRVQALSDDTVWVEYYDESYNLLSVKQIPMELPVFGGFYAAEDGYYYIISGAYNTAESNSAEVFRITKYDSSWNRISSASLYGANTIEPFGAGAARFAEYGGYIVIHTAHGMYKTSDGYSHQANMTIQLNTSSMTITDSYTDIMNIEFGYVSHSFNQFVEIDDGHIITLDHGDAEPRSLVIGRYTSPVTSGKFINGATIFNYSEIYKIPDNATEHYNFTGVAAGGFEATSSGYLTAISSVDMNNYNPNGSRDIYVIHTAKSGGSFGSSTVKRITTDGGFNAPQLVKISDSRFILLWSKNNTVYYTSLDANGNMTSSIYSLSGNLSDCVPVVNGGKIVWYTYENADVTFYEISASDLSQNNAVDVIAGHDFEYLSTVNGTAELECKKCGKRETITVPTEIKIFGKKDTSDPLFYRPMPTELQADEKLYILASMKPENTEDSELEVIISDETILTYNEDIGALFPKGNGETQVTFRVKYNPEIAETYTIKATHKHIYSEEWTIDAEATCAVAGSKSKHCILCDEKGEITEIPMTGHDFSDDFIIDIEPTCQKNGAESKHCSICGERTGITEIPMTGHDFSDDFIVDIEPTCQKNGAKSKHCSICGERIEITPILATDHKFGDFVIAKEPTCKSKGLKQRVCEYCGMETDWTEIPTTDHELETKVIEPTYEEMGYTLHTCKNCDYSRKTDFVGKLTATTSAQTTPPVVTTTTPVTTTTRVTTTTPVTTTTRATTTTPVTTTTRATTTTPVTTTTRATTTTPVTTTTRATTTTPVTTTTRATTTTPVTTTTRATTTTPVTTTTRATTTTPVTTTTRVTTTTPAETKKPAEVQGVTVNDCGLDSAVIEWKPANYVEGYIVKEKIDGEYVQVKKLYGNGNIEYICENLEPDTVYYFKIHSYLKGVESEGVNVTVKTLPLELEGKPIITVESVSEREAVISWTPVKNAEKYVISFAETYGTRTITVSGEETSSTVYGLPTEATTIITVTPMIGNISGESDSTSVTTVAKKPTTSWSIGGETIEFGNSNTAEIDKSNYKVQDITGIEIVWNASDAVGFNWNGLTNVDGYVIQQYIDGNWVDVKITNMPMFRRFRLTPNTEYRYRVCSYVGTERGNYTEVTTTTTAED